MAELIEGIDISKYQGSVDQPTWRALRKAGQEVAVVGSWHGRDGNPFCRDNLIRAAAQGMAIATYIVLNGQQPGNAAVSQGKSFCGNMWSDLRFVAIDCELDGITETHIRQAEAAIIAEGQTPIIYTAYWWWHGRFGNPSTFKHLPLWNAYYDQQPDIDFPTLPYGGWEDVVAEQYAGSVQLEGVTVDRNSFRRDFIHPKQQEDDMNPVLAQDPALPGYVWTVWLNAAGLPMWKAHLLSFGDAVAPFPIKEMTGLKSVGILPTSEQA